jgi:hypothetical protein
MLRVYPILLDEGKLIPNSATWMDTDQKLGERTYALRSVYDSLSTVLPATAVIQYNPDAGAFVLHSLYSFHAATAGDGECGAVFGGDLVQCKSRMQALMPLFGNPTAEQNTTINAVCREYAISAMVVDDHDPVWKQHDSWVWTNVPMRANAHVRAFNCGDLEQQAKLASGTKQ